MIDVIMFVVSYVKIIECKMYYVQWLLLNIIMDVVMLKMNEM